MGPRIRGECGWLEESGADTVPQTRIARALVLLVAVESDVFSAGPVLEDLGRADKARLVRRGGGEGRQLHCTHRARASDGFEEHHVAGVNAQCGLGSFLRAG